MKKDQIKELHAVCNHMIALDPERINQSSGVFDKKKPCCVGAHLANFLEAEKNAYQAGISAFCQAIGATRDQAVVMLQEAGAGYDPFDAQKWPIPVAEVFANLRKIEKLPSVNRSSTLYFL